MKKTNEELLKFFGLKVGDKVKVEDDKSVYNILKEDEVCEENDKYKHINCWSTTSFGSYLISRNYEVITPKKKLGDMNCDEMLCRKCPLRAIDCNAKGKTLYEALEKYRKSLNSFNGSLEPFEKTIIASIKAELDKEVEE